MVDFGASPQLKAIKRLMNAYTSLDMNNVGPLLSKNYQQQSFPASTDPPEEVRRRRFGRFKEISVRVGNYWKCVSNTGELPSSPQIDVRHP